MDPALLLGCSGKALGLFPGLWGKFHPGTARRTTKSWEKKYLSMGSQENAGWEEAEEAIQPNLLHRSGQLSPVSLSLGHQTGLLPLFPTCHSGSFSSEKIWKYFCASCTGGSVCSFRLVQELRKRTRCLKVYKPRRSLP